MLERERAGERERERERERGGERERGREGERERERDVKLSSRSVEEKDNPSLWRTENRALYARGGKAALIM